MISHMVVSMHIHLLQTCVCIDTCTHTMYAHNTKHQNQKLEKKFSQTLFSKYPDNPGERKRLPQRGWLWGWQQIENKGATREKVLGGCILWVRQRIFFSNFIHSFIHFRFFYIKSARASYPEAGKPKKTLT